MTLIERTTGLIVRWLDDTAAVLAGVLTRLAAPRTIRLIEQPDGRFVLADGQNDSKLQFDGGKLLAPEGTQPRAVLRRHQVDLVLRAERFIFKPLELPARAAEFLDGIVRSQIDRLTPWTAEHSAFGITAPSDAGGGRILLTVAATAKSVLRPFVDAVASLGAQSVSVSVVPPDVTPPGPAIVVLERNIAGIDQARLRRALAVILMAAAVLTAAGATAASFIGDGLQERQDQVARKIAARRAAVIAARNAAVDPATAAERALAQRKNETPSAVIVLEVLSKILPDHTYVTELRIEGDKLRIIGITRDAPSLIRLLEQSPHFTHAAFFAPTTRAPADPGDRFNIEARLMPVFSPRS